MLVLRGHRHAIHTLAFSAEGRELFSLARRGRGIFRWDLAAGAFAGLVWKSEHRVTHFAVSPRSADLLVVILTVRQIHQLHLERRHVVSLGAVTGSSFGAPLRLAFSPDGRFLACSGRTTAGPRWVAGATLPLWQRRGEVFLPASVPALSVSCVDQVSFGPQGRLVAFSQTRRGEVEVWNVEEGRRLHTLWHGGKYLRVAFAPDGRLLAAGHPGGRVRVWDVATGERRLGLDHGFDNRGVVRPGARGQRGTVHGTEKVMSAMSWTPDGQALATAGTDGIVRFWDPSSGRLLRAYDWQVGPLHSLTFAPDGQRAAAGGRGVIVVWDVDL